MYDAFISYSRDSDSKLASAMRNALHRFTKPWYRLRSLHVFSDQTNLSANPGLWTSIQNAIRNSKSLILLACPKAARSEWVNKEVRCWLESGAEGNILIALTEGDIVWDEANGDFDWNSTTSLPKVMQGRFREEPLYVDLRWTRESADLSLNNPLLYSATADLASALTGRPKDELIGEDVSEHKRTRKWALRAIAALVILTVFALLSAYIAILQMKVAKNQRAEAIRQRNFATSRQLAAEARVLQQYNSGASLVQSALLAIESMKISPSLSAYLAWSKAMDLMSPLHSKFRATPIHGRIRDLYFNHDTSGLLVISGQCSNVAAGDPVQERECGISLWNPEQGIEIKRFSYPGNQGFLVSSGGQTLLAYGAGMVYVWDLAERKLLLSKPIENGALRAVSNNGRYIAIAGFANIVVWDLKQHGQLLATVTINDNRLKPLKDGRQSSLAISNDGRRLALSHDSSVGILDLSIGKLIAIFRAGSSVGELRFSPKADKLVVTSYSAGVYTVDPASGKEVAPALDPEMSDKYLSSEGRYVATIHRMFSNGKVAETATGRVLLSLEEANVSQAVFSENSKRLAMLWEDNSIHVWNVPSMEEITRVVPEQKAVFIALSPDGKQLTASTTEGLILTWNLRDETFHIPSGNELSSDEVLRNPIAVISDSDLAPNCENVKVWDIFNKREIFRLNLRQDHCPSSAVLSPDGRHLAVLIPANESGNELGGAGTDTIVIFETGKGRQLLRLVPERGHKFSWYSFSKDSKSIFTCSCQRNEQQNSSEFLQIWRLENPAMINRIRTKRCNHWRSKKLWVGLDAAYSNLAQVVNSGLENKAALLLEEVERQTASFLEKQPDYEGGIGIEDIAFSADGRFLAVASAMETVLWRIDNAVFTRVFAEPYTPAKRDWREAAETVIFSPDSHYLARGTRSNTALIWETVTGRKVATLSHDDAVTGIAFSNDGHTVATASRDHTAKVWNLGDGQSIAGIRHMDAVDGVVFSHDGRYVISRDRKGSFRKWLWQRDDLVAEACGRLPRNLTRPEWQSYLPDQEYRPTCPNLPVSP